MRTWLAGRWIVLALHLVVPIATVVEIARRPEVHPAVDLFPAIVFAIYGFLAALSPPDSFFGSVMMVGWAIAACVIDVMAGALLMGGLAVVTDQYRFGGYAYFLLLGSPVCAVVWLLAWASGFFGAGARLRRLSDEG